MPTSLSDFCGQVSSHAGASGAAFRTVANPDGSVQILRSANSTSGRTWSVLYPRISYHQPNDTVLVGDGSGMSASSASAFISGLS
jgi:hypothetical protein